ncbi:MAG: HAMP domain-containing protein [Cytophagales bacterium]|nr:MAG: HAMP domain-containing protein [Cytophagales bacterium]
MKVLLASMRSRFILVIFTFILLMALSTLTALWFLDRNNNLKNLIVDQEKLAIHLLKVINIEHDFIHYESTNAKFFETSHSEYLKKHKIAIDSAHQLIDKMAVVISQSFYEPSAKTIISTHNQQVKKALSYYEQVFDTLVKLTIQKGFKDFGVEGQMRQQILFLEKNSTLNELNLLNKIRRNEKDFMLRKDTLYATQVLDDIAEFEVILKKNSAIKDSVKKANLSILKQYKEKFQLLVNIEQAISSKTQNGVYEKLKQQGDVLSNVLEQYAKAVNDFSNIQIARARISFLIIVGLTLLASLLGGYYFISRITKPLTVLSKDIVRITGDLLNDHEILKTEASTNDEIVQLSSAFELLIKEMQKQLVDIRTTTNELEAQNADLTVINEQIAQSEDKLKKLNTVKNKFLSIISHDLRSPLNSIMGFLDALERYANIFTPDETQQFSRDMQRSVKRILDLLENLLQWSLSHTGEIEYKPEVVNVADIFEENIQLYEKSAQDKKIMLIVEPSAKVVTMVEADRNMFNFIVRNLLSNAIKFSRADDRIMLNLLPENNTENEAHITVSDTGVGMTQEQISKLFQSNIQNISTLGTNKEKGTGLGLLLCKEFVERNGGKIWIESQINIGTTVHFTLKKA